MCMPMPWYCNQWNSGPPNHTSLTLQSDDQTRPQALCVVPMGSRQPPSHTTPRLQYRKAPLCGISVSKLGQGSDWDLSALVLILCHHLSLKAGANVVPKVGEQRTKGIADGFVCRSNRGTILLAERRLSVIDVPLPLKRVLSRWVRYEL